MELIAFEVEAFCTHFKLAKVDLKDYKAGETIYLPTIEPHALTISVGYDSIKNACHWAVTLDEPFVVIYSGYHLVRAIQCLDRVLGEKKKGG